MTRADDARRASSPFAVVTAAAIWGPTGTATHFAPGVPPFVFGAMTFGLGGFVMAGIAARPTIRALRTRGALRLVLLAAAALAVYAVAFYAALAWAGVALGTTVAIGTSPAFAGLVDLVVAGRRVTRRWMIANVVSVAGMALVTIARAGGPGADVGLIVLGVLCGLVAGLTYALYTWAVAEVVSTGRGCAAGSSVPGSTVPGSSVPGSSVRGVVGAVFGLAAVPLVVVVLLVGTSSLTVAANWPVFVYLALVPTVLGHTLYAVGLRTVSASAATLLSLIEPVVAAVLAVLVVGEHLGAVGWVGVAGVVVGLGVLGIPGRLSPSR